MIHFATGADSGYVLRTLCLARSWAQHEPAGRFWAFPWDERALQVLEALAPHQAQAVPPAQYWTPELQVLRARRTPLELACTLKPVVLQHVMARIAPGDWVAWLDGDMSFFRSAERLIGETPASCLLTPHRFTPAFRDLEPTVGKFNAGFVAFRKTPAGQRCLDWWTEQCLRRCSAVPADGHYTDQKYLDTLAERFADVTATAVLAINAGPWNSLERPVRHGAGCVTIGDEPLVLYHFQGLRIVRRRLFDLYADNRLRLPRPLVEAVYRPYLTALRQTSRQLTTAFPTFQATDALGFRRGVLRPLKCLLLRRGNFLVA